MNNVCNQPVLVPIGYHCIEKKIQLKSKGNQNCLVTNILQYIPSYMFHLRKNTGLEHEVEYFDRSLMFGWTILLSSTHPHVILNLWLSFIHKEKYWIMYFFINSKYPYSSFLWWTDYNVSCRVMRLSTIYTVTADLFSHAIRWYLCWEGLNVSLFLENLSFLWAVHTQKLFKVMFPGIKHCVCVCVCACVYIYIAELQCWWLWHL